MTYPLIPIQSLNWRLSLADNALVLLVPVLPVATGYCAGRWYVRKCESYHLVYLFNVEANLSLNAILFQFVSKMLQSLNDVLFNHTRAYP